VLAASPALVACGPAMDAVVGIGLDDGGDLVAVAKVCDDDVAQVDLYTQDPEVLVLSWRRDEPLTGTESWRLDTTSGGWRSDDDTPPGLDPDAVYGLWATRSRGDVTSWVTFTGEEVGRLQPGHLLVRRPDRLSAASDSSEVSVIGWDDLRTWNCGW
jgi:hypothetical protein